MDDLQAYNDIDPDYIYDNAPQGSMTFFYIPKTKNLHIKPYPTSHRDMMEDEAIAFDVYQRPIKKIEKVRQKVLDNTDALLGRIGVLGEFFCIALWSHPSMEVFGNFLDKLYSQYPNFKKIQDKTIVIFPHRAEYLTKVIGGNVNPKRAVKLKRKETPRQTDTKKYDIGHGTYSLSDLQQLRSAIHTKANTGLGDPMAILCHPDLAKYPELAGYRPATCVQSNTVRSTHPSNWRRAAWKAGIYAYESITFADWITYHDMFTEQTYKMV